MVGHRNKFPVNLLHYQWIWNSRHLNAIILLYASYLAPEDSDEYQVLISLCFLGNGIFHAKQIIKLLSRLLRRFFFFFLIFIQYVQC